MQIGVTSFGSAFGCEVEMNAGDLIFMTGGPGGLLASDRFYQDSQLPQLDTDQHRHQLWDVMEDLVNGLDNCGGGSYLVKTLSIYTAFIMN